MKWFGVISLSFFIGILGEAAPIKMQSIQVNVRDKESLQRGAKIFMNYCSGCHALRFLRYNRMAQDLGLTTFDGQVDEDLLNNNLVFTSAKVFDPIQISMPKVDARQWFGKEPPDLSLTARERGSAWLYTYLNSFYADPTRPFGANNRLVPEVAMPNVLAPMQGKVIAPHVTSRQDFPLILVQPGAMTPQQFDRMLEDVVTFLTYVAEPSQLIRYRLGAGVMIFLGIFSIVAYRLKKLYWHRV